MVVLFIEVGSIGRREGLSRRNDVFGFGLLVLRCFWDILVDFEDSCELEEEVVSCVKGDKVCSFLFSVVREFF